jgi:hypothetical protein
LGSLKPGSKPTIKFQAIISLLRAEKLENPHVALGAVLVPGDTLTVAFDKTVRVGGSALGTGGEAGGVNTTGGGGYGVGGQGNEKSVTGVLGMAGVQKGTKGLPVRVTAGCKYGFRPWNCYRWRRHRWGVQMDWQGYKEARCKEANPTNLGLRGVMTRL